MLRKQLVTGLVGLSAALLASAVVAEKPIISGKQDLVCASQSVLACTSDQNCMQGKASTFDLPNFMFVDFKAKNVRAVDEDGSVSNSPVKSHEVTEQSLIMQGFENHRGWTMAVDRGDGSFTVSATGPDVNFMIMGACTAL